MHNLTCLIKGCQARVYTPAGTHSICREYFLGYLTQPGLLMNASAAIVSFPARGKWPEASGEDFRSETRLFPLAPSLAPVAWPVGAISRRTIMNNVGSRRRKGPQMFMKYAGMTMEERDPFVTEGANTICVEELPTASAPKT